MKQIVIICILLASSSLYADEFLPGDAAKGKALLDRDCTSCHGSKVYTRPNRIKTLGGLQKRVEMCSKMINKGYTSNDEDNIVKYLNQRYYRFKSE